MRVVTLESSFHGHAVVGEAWRYLGPVPPRPTNLFAPSLFVWLLRILWVALAVTLGFAIANATRTIDGAAGFVAPLTWNLAIGLAVLSLVVPSTIGLTVVRLLTPAAVPAAAIAWWYGDNAALGAAATALAVVTSLVAFSGEVGEAMVSGASYGSEQRFPLRPPAALVPPIALSWVLWCGGLVGGIVVISQGSWALGLLLTAAAVALTWFLFRRFHRFSRRWLVVVPAGVVVHDPVMLGETLMVQRTNVAEIRLALAGTEAADLTGPAGGHALDVAVHDMVLAVFPATETDPKGRAIHVQSFLVAPSRPGRALQALAAAKLPVG